MAEPRTDQRTDQRQQGERNRSQRMEQDKQNVAQNREQLAKVQEEQREAHKGTPTPTQEEADMIKLGHHVELAKDGSEEDPNVGFTQEQLVGGGTYKRRDSVAGEQRQLPGGQPAHSSSPHQPGQQHSPSHQTGPTHTSPRPPEHNK